MRGRPRKQVAQADSDEPHSSADTNASDSDVVVNGNLTNKRAARGCRGRRKRQRIIIPDDSDDDSVAEPDASSRNSSQNGLNDSCSSDSDSAPVQSNASPQPSTSGINTHQTNGVQNNSEPSDSGSETPDSDCMMPEEEKDTRKVTPKKRGKQPVRSSPRAKIQKQISNSFGGVDSHKDSRGLNRLNSSVGAKSQKDNALFDPAYIEALAHKCVYFLLIEDQKKYAIKRKAIVANVFKDESFSSKLYSAVIFKTNIILRKTFGMELIANENQKDSYLLVNILKRELSVEEFIELPRLKHHQQGLVLYLLTIIFMNNNCITEDELVKALKELNIDYTSKKPHAIFGDVKKFISTELVKQMYLNYECINKDPPQFEITWGVRAKEEVDKRDLLPFACKIMDETSPESWILQYKDAEESAKNLPE